MADYTIQHIDDHLMALAGRLPLSVTDVGNHFYNG